MANDGYQMWRQSLIGWCDKQTSLTAATGRSDPQADAWRRQGLPGTLGMAYRRLLISLTFFPVNTPEVFACPKVCVIAFGVPINNAGIARASVINKFWAVASPNATVQPNFPAIPYGSPVRAPFASAHATSPPAVDVEL